MNYFMIGACCLDTLKKKQKQQTNKNNDCHKAIKVLQNVFEISAQSIELFLLLISYCSSFLLTDSRGRKIIGNLNPNLFFFVLVLSFRSRY